MVLQSWKVITSGVGQEIILSNSANFLAVSNIDSVSQPRISLGKFQKEGIQPQVICICSALLYKYLIPSLHSSKLCWYWLRLNEIEGPMKMPLARLLLMGRKGKYIPNSWTEMLTLRAPFPVGLTTWTCFLTGLLWEIKSYQPTAFDTFFQWKTFLQLRQKKVLESRLKLGGLQ